MDYFYNRGWQVLETRRSVSENTGPESLQPEYQYVWSLRYIDAPVPRDENTDADSLCDDARIYYLGDANFNVTTLVDTAGDAVERYIYSPYGVLTVYDATWANIRSDSSYAVEYTYTGRRFDPETGLYYYRHRMYAAELGRFLSRDPVKTDPNLYRVVRNSPLQFLDPSGLQCCVCKFERYSSGESSVAIDQAYIFAGNVGPASAGIFAWWDDFTGEFKHRGFPNLPHRPKPPLTAGGPFVYRGEPYQLKGHTAQMRVGVALFWVTADVKEDSPGDCLVQVTEKIHNYSMPHGDKEWVKGEVETVNQTGGFIAPPVYTGRQLGTILIGTLKTPGANPKVPEKPINPVCTKRIVFTDMPRVADVSIENGVNVVRTVNRMVVKPQTLAVKDKKSGREWSVSQWFDLSPDHYEFHGIPSNVGAPPTDVGKCC